MSAVSEGLPLDLPALVRDRRTRVIVTCGSGGVGKTTTAAAVALLGAEAGRRTVVLTIDPARRLAQSMGLTELDNTPREVHGVQNGRLFAMMLDMKRTFDDVVLQHAPPDRAAQILQNPFYVSLSSSFAGTQEYMAMEKLGQLVAQTRSSPEGSSVAEWDLIVVDTPPSRSALDFLDAPNRLGRFLDGRMIRLLMMPARAGGKAYLKVVSASVTMFARVFTRILGTQLLTDVSSFVSALETMFGGFRERADQTYELLKTPGTSFVVVASPEPDALREASYFVERLSEERMPLAGLVLNRVRRTALDSSGATLSAARAEAAADALSAKDGDEPTALAEAALRVHSELAHAAEYDRRMARRFAAAHPEVPTVSVPALPGDVHDLDGLREIGALLSVQRTAA